MPQVYAVVYCRADTTCLIAEKRTRGFYFAGAAIADQAGQILNYSGQDVFPGGALNPAVGQVPAEAPNAGAIREFLEETGVDLTAIVSIDTAVRSFNARGVDITGAAGVVAFHCLYVNVSAPILAQLVIDVNTNLVLPQHERMQVVADDELLHVFTEQYPQCRVPLTTFVAQRADAQYGNRSRDKGWFGNIIDAIP